MPVTTPTIDGTFNVRDVASAGPGRAGPLTAGVLWRTGMLARLTDQGRHTLTDLGVTQVFDLRSDHERHEAGLDAVPPGVTVYPLTFNPEGFEETTTADVADIARRLSGGGDGSHAGYQAMIQTYRGFVLQAEARHSTGQALQLLAGGTGASVVHCTAGKDRTGWFTALLLHILGVDWDLIMADYLRSRQAAPVLRRLIPPSADLSPADLEPIITVEPDYLGAGWNAAEEQYGTIDQFLDTIGVHRDVRDALLVRFGQTLT